MKLFRRLTSTVTATVDQAVSHIENHDAVVAAALQDARKSAAEARVRLRTVQRDGEALRQRCEQLRGDVAQWAERARRSAAEDDEPRALQCVARMREAQRTLQSTEAAYRRHQAQQAALEQAAAQIRKRIKRIEQQRHLLRTRQSSAQAQHLAARLDAAEGEGVDEVLARWESSILAKEDLPWDEAADPLQEEFQREEDEQALRESLRELLDNTPAGKREDGDE